MSISDWKKRWCYHSKVEIPKTTKWRRRCENINNGISDDIPLVDVWEDLSSDTIELGNNTSPFKRQRLLRDSLSNLPTNTSSSIIKRCERKNSYGNFCMQTENAEELELCPVLSDGFYTCIFFVCLRCSLSYDNCYKTVFHSFKFDCN